MNKHTPGPWGFLNYTDDESLLSFGVSSKEEMLDRTRTGWYSLWCGIKPEDARLIAAAPELLEACQTFAEWLRREDEGFVKAGKSRDTPEGEAAWREWYFENLRICDLAQEQARNAISKATGAA